MRADALKAELDRRYACRVFVFRRSRRHAEP
jgi:hypothetical protein